MDSHDTLALRTNAKQQLQNIKDIEGGIEYHNKLVAMETYLQLKQHTDKEKIDGELQNMIAEQKIRTQKIIGRLIKEGQEKGEIASQSKGGANIPDGVKVDDTVKTLSDLGITRNQSSTFQKIDAMPEDKFEEVIAEKKNSKSELTTAAMLKACVELGREEKIIEIKKAVTLPDTKYRVVLADPPWSYGNTQPDYHTEQRDHYPVMSLDEVCAMPIRTLTLDDAVLFLWVTSPILEESFQVVKAWGFHYKTSFIWDKIKHNMGHYNSVRHEFLLVCTRGSCQPDVKKLFDSVITEERTEHSKKPEIVYEIIDTIYPYGKRIELFARQDRNGWDKYGYEA